ncbi:hypothetical protein ABFT23_18965 [Nocardioides sp. C4-1]|uniref:hypothetical protein n=1 Tax=Nocardioides sp. C4-1 TaxID=3151851 RepID=UPI0032673469
MTSHGYELGVDLANLWNAGKNLIGVQLVGELQAGADALPATIDNFYRGGSWSQPDASVGPQASVNAYVAALKEILTTTASNYAEVGEALVYIANNYEFTDGEAQTEFDNRRRDIVNGEGTS